ncbi:hypothetical protein niasHT_022953 [Heterodera trifolii]|uniref:Uncharacterized protein n=1 Tax=Heterodera trifolii TaxID=157864 RepID=A0ABD2KJ04_9BILA
MSKSPPSKRARRFFIEELLREPYNELSPPKKSPKVFVKKLDSEVEHVPKFQWMKTKSRFVIEDVPTDPEGLLIGIFQQCIDETISDSRLRGVEPTHLGCIVSSALLTSDIWIPLRQMTTDTINTILNRFNDVAQSKKQDGVTLWGEPFTVTMTTVNRNGLPEKRQLKGGAARKLTHVHHRIHEQCLIKIKNFDGDNYCLFLAMQATMTRALGGLTRQRFYDYMNGNHCFHGKLKMETLEMINAVNAPPKQPNYDAETYVPRDGHFSGVQKSGNLFGRPYCLSCESTYDRPKQHSVRCKARCIKCSQMGPTFPCKPIAGIRIKCNECNKTFFNDACHQYHLSSNFCKLSKECKYCGVVWDMHNNTRNGREGHKCNERWCENCQIFHEFGRGCFIRPLEPNKKKETIGWRLVTFDVETMQHEAANPDFPQRRKHQVNFVTAKVACPSCISSGKWRESLRGKFCNICGYHRTITFSQKPFSETTVDRQQSLFNGGNRCTFEANFCDTSSYQEIR